MRTMKVLQMIAVVLIVSMLSCKKDSASGPKVLSADPSQSQTGVARNKAIEFTFSEAMDPSTINNSTFTVMQGSTVVPGTVVYAGTKATFTPTAVLAPGTSYTATITTGARNLAGTSYSFQFSFEFYYRGKFIHINGC